MKRSAGATSRGQRTIATPAIMAPYEQFRGLRTYGNISKEYSSQIEKLGERRVIYAG